MKRIFMILSILALAECLETDLLLLQGNAVLYQRNAEEQLAVESADDQEEFELLDGVDEGIVWGKDELPEPELFALFEKLDEDVAEDSHGESPLVVPAEDSYHVNMKFGSQYCPNTSLASSSFDSIMQSCSKEGTVLASSMASRYAASMQQLVHSAAKLAGIPCTLIFAQEDFSELCDPSIVPVFLEGLPHPSAEFCMSQIKYLYGWRRTQFHKTFALRRVVSAGFNLLLIDADRVILGDFFPYLNIMATKGFDVVGKIDKGSKYLNFGLFWMRSTASTIKAAHRIYNRTFGGWDQFVMNQELDGLKLSTCYSWDLKHFAPDVNNQERSSPLKNPSCELLDAHVVTADKPNTKNLDFPWKTHKFNVQGWLMKPAKKGWLRRCPQVSKDILHFSAEP